jgi:hypothetical protein
MALRWLGEEREIVRAERTWVVGVGGGEEGSKGKTGGKRVSRVLQS